MENKNDDLIELLKMATKVTNEAPPPPNPPPCRSVKDSSIGIVALPFIIAVWIFAYCFFP